DTTGHRSDDAYRRSNDGSPDRPQIGARRIRRAQSTGGTMCRVTVRACRNAAFRTRVHQVERRRVFRRSAAAALTAVLLLGALASVPAAHAGGEAAELVRLKEEIARMKADYERRIRALERRIELLERAGPGPENTARRPTGTTGGTNVGAASARPGLAARATGASVPTVASPPAPASQEEAVDAELEALRAAAKAAAGAPQSEETVSTGGTKAPASGGVGPGQVGHERNLNRLNPEISFTGDVVARAEGATKTFDAREFELDLQAALDPFSSTKWTISFGPEQVDVEEGYIKYTGLGHGVTLRAGKMRQSFGVLNRFHQHALPQPDYPLVLQRMFGEEGLAQTGLSVEWLVPRPWAS
ncbi:MAG: hypothetical protein D6760_12725, partial [Deltaproteobacteria bacterium]